MLYWTIAALIPFLAWTVSVIRNLHAVRVVPEMANLPLPDGDQPLPKVSVIVPARNEAASVEKCLTSLLEQDYPDFEVIAINDRSTDTTGEIIDKVAASQGSEESRIVPVHVTELPEGWLGKCNALAQGAAQAKGELLLFTDGDVIFERSVLLRSVNYIREKQADLMVVMPDIIPGSFLEQVVILDFGQGMLAAFPPAKAMDRRSNKFVGVGAFNMITAKCYKKIHGHRFIRLQVVDDAGLGKLVKHSGSSICVAFGRGMVRVRWQESVMGLVRGLEKNSFAVMNYSVARTLVASVGILYLHWWPWIGLFAGPWFARLFCALTILIHTLMGIGAWRRIGTSPLAGLFLPLGGLIMVFTVLRSMVITLKQGGIRWRDSFYPLKELKQFRL